MNRVFKSIKMLHLALVAGLLIFTGVAVAFKLTNTFPSLDESVDRILQVVVILISLPALFFGFRLFKKKIMQARNMNGSAYERLMAYRSACVLWWGMIDFPGVFAIVGFLLTGNFAYLFLATFHILLLFLFMPRKQNVAVLLNFNSEDLKDFS